MPRTRTVVMKTKKVFKPADQAVVDEYVNIYSTARFHAFHVLNIYLLLLVEGQHVPPGGAAPPKPNELITQKTVGQAIALVRGTNGLGSSSVMLEAFRMYNAEPGVSG